MYDRPTDTANGLLQRPSSFILLVRLQVRRSDSRMDNTDQWQDGQWKFLRSKLHNVRSKWKALQNLLWNIC